MNHEQRKRQKLERRKKRQEKQKKRAEKFVSKIVNKIKQADAIAKAKQIVQPTFDRSAWLHPQSNAEQSDNVTPVLKKQGFDSSAWKPKNDT